jgi:hypothetical protein
MMMSHITTAGEGMVGESMEVGGSMVGGKSTSIKRKNGVVKVQILKGTMW